MPRGNATLPVTLGQAADDLLVERGVRAEEALTLLQIYVHARSREEFAFYVDLALGWPAIDSWSLWQAIDLSDGVSRD